MEIILGMLFVLWLFGLLLWMGYAIMSLIGGHIDGYDGMIQLGAKMILAAPVYPIVLVYILVKHAFPMDESSSGKVDEDQPQSLKTLKKYPSRPRRRHSHRSLSPSTPEYDSSTWEPK